MGMLSPRLDTPWQRFLNSPPITGLLRSYKDLERSFTESVTKLMVTTDVDGGISGNWAAEVARDFDPLALDFILRRLAEHSAQELAEMARSFSFASCDVHEDQLETLRPFLHRG